MIIKFLKRKRIKMIHLIATMELLQKQSKLLKKLNLQTLMSINLLMRNQFHLNRNLQILIHII